MLKNTMIAIALVGLAACQPTEPSVDITVSPEGTVAVSDSITVELDGDVEGYLIEVQFPNDVRDPQWVVRFSPDGEDYWNRRFEGSYDDSGATFKLTNGWVETTSFRVVVTVWDSAEGASEESFDFVVAL